MQPRAIHYISTLLVGLGIGVFAYRFAILGFFWTGSLKWVFPGVSVALIAAGFKLQSLDTQSERPAGTTRIALAIVGIGAAMGLLYLLVPTLDRMSLERREIAGFSFELPTAKPDIEVIDYNTGSITWKEVGGANAVATVSWQVGTTSKEDLDVAIKALSSEIGTGTAPVYSTLPGPNGTQIDTVKVDTNKDVPLRLSALPCGNRGMIVMTIGAAGIEAVHERIVASFRCTPDAAKESTEPGTVRVALSLPGWYVEEREVGQLSVTDGKAVLIMREISGHQTNLPDVVTPMLNALGGNITAKPVVGDRVPFSGTIGDEPVEGWARMVQCPTHNVLLLLMAHTSVDADAAYVASSNAGCLRDGEKPPTFPEAAPGAPRP